MARPPRHVLGVEPLESRLALSLTFRFDYSLDTGGFFADPARRTALQQAADALASRIDSNPDALTPVGGNTWAASIFDPATGKQVRIDNPTVRQGEILVYAGARDLPAGQAAVGGTGGYSMGGDAAWMATVRTRGQTGFSLWGGSISFDTTQSWFTGADVAAKPTGQVDMVTVATHELGHVLGFGTSAAWTKLVSAQRFTGPAATAVNGGVAPTLSADLAHWTSNTRYAGGPASLGATVVSGGRYGFTDLDYAALQDIGWAIRSAGASPPVTPNPVPDDTDTPTGPAPIDSTPTDVEVAPTPLKLCPPGCACSACTVIGGADGTVRLVDFSNPTPNVGPAFRPFSDFFGEVRATLADVTGDGQEELISVTGPGGGSRIRVTDPLTGSDVVSEWSAFEPSFTGGLFVAAADVTGDGRADVIVSPDSGGGGRVTVFEVNGGVRVAANYFGIDDPNFRGGARVAAADVDGDGRADLVVGAGTGGGPRIAVWDGRSLSVSPRRLVSDFFAFGGADAASLRNGVYVAAGDLTGDGRAELAFGGGPGGSPRVLVLDGASLVSGGGMVVSNRFAFDASDRSGARVTIDNVGGVPSLVVGAGNGAGVMVYPRGVGNGASFDLGGAMAAGGVFVG